MGQEQSQASLKLATLPTLTLNCQSARLYFPSAGSQTRVSCMLDKHCIMVL